MLSNLCNKILLSPNHSGKRKYNIERITPHCFVGQCSVYTGLNAFQKRGSDPVSSNYVIGYDGQIGGCVDEDNRAWTSSSFDNDNRAITVEIASDNKAPYKMSDEAFKALVFLTVDIMRRYNKTKLVYIPNKQQALLYNCMPNELLVTFHRWFNSKKSCPGQWFIDNCDRYVHAVNENFKPIENIQKEGFVMVELPVLQFGSTGNAVKNIQVLLKSKGYKNPSNKVLVIDGIFGDSTLYAVKNFQKDNGMDPDGIIGVKSYTALFNT